MKPQTGKYFFGRRWNGWGIWQWSVVTENSSISVFIKEVLNYEEAVREMYRLNGWGEPKNVKRAY